MCVAAASFANWSYLRFKIIADNFFDVYGYVRFGIFAWIHPLHFVLLLVGPLFWCSAVQAAKYICFG